MSLRELSLEHMVNTTPPPVPWVCDGLVARGALTLLAGEPSSGKSWLALGMALGVSNGAIVAGIPCHLGSTLYIDAENGPNELHRRVHQLKLTTGVAFYEANGFDLVHNLDELSAHFVKHQPSLVVLDGLRSLWSGDENDSGMVTSMLMVLRRALRSFDVGCLLLHHMNKTGGYRGSGALAAEPEIVVQMSADEEPGYTQLTWHKCRMGPPPMRQRFRVATRFGTTQLLP